MKHYKRVCRWCLKSFLARRKDKVLCSNLCKKKEWEFKQISLGK